MVIKRVDCIVFQVELSQMGTGGERAFRQGGKIVPAQPQDSEAGKDWRGTWGHLWDLKTETVDILNLNKYTCNE